MLNLDYKCMEWAQNINEISDSDLENNLRKALGVLQEDGVYAMFLWLENKDKKISIKLLNMLNDQEIKKYFLNDSSFPENFKEFCEKLKEVAKDIDKLLFMKRLLERTLVYALYHARIRG
ncbi:MAG: hypothetical protein QXP04_02110 [Candidatus Nanoarchaeia archaeon]|nr:hypothetical protein [Candidatus Jingweiarchaeum tengchongense]